MAIHALLFDLDGTLIDSEIQTDAAIAKVMEPLGHSGAFLPTEKTRGRSWFDISKSLIERYQITITLDALIPLLEKTWNQLTTHTPPIPGAVEAVLSASKFFKLAIVSSSPTSVIEFHINRLGLKTCIPKEFYVGADQVQRYKPHPEGFLTAAQRLQVLPEQCLVFEDISAGLTAARDANMASIAILHSCAEPVYCRSLAKDSWKNFLGVTDETWSTLAGGTLSKTKKQGA